MISFRSSFVISFLKKRLDIQRSFSALPERSSQKSSILPRFDDIKSLHPLILKSLDEVFKYTTMTPVQHKVLLALPTDKDIMVRAKTGTGKTLAFLIAALQKIDLSSSSYQGYQIIILSPTRELAIQTFNEAQKLLRFLPSLNVALVCGGMHRGTQLKAIAYEEPAVLCCTPGRLIDFLNSERKVKKRMDGCRVLILDEADRLLEMGFKEAIEQVVHSTPPTHETLLFSATLKGTQIAKSTLKPSYLSIDCIDKNEQDSHTKIRQSYAVTSYQHQLPLLLDIIQTHKSDQSKLENVGGKIIVFFPTTSMVEFFSEVFRSQPGVHIMQIHSKMTQDRRMKVSDRFRVAQSAVLFTTDVSARGVDYPGVSLVVQMGAPDTSDSYIHRVGRTGRAGNHGEAIMIMSSFETRFLDLIKNQIPIKEDLRYKGEISFKKTHHVESIQRAIKRAPREESFGCFSNWIGFYQQAFSRYQLQKSTIIAAAQEFSEHMLGQPEIPRELMRKLTTVGGGGGKQRRSSGPSSNFGNYGDPKSYGGGGNSFGDWKSGGSGDRSSYGGRDAKNYGGSSFGGERSSNGYGGRPSSSSSSFQQRSGGSSQHSGGGSSQSSEYRGSEKRRERSQGWSVRALRGQLDSSGGWSGKAFGDVLKKESASNY